MVLSRENSTAYSDIHMLFRDSVRRLLSDSVAPKLNEWAEKGQLPESFWRECGEVGMLCPQVPEAYGGPGLDFSYNAVVAEELGYLGFPPSVLVHSDIVADYLLAYGSEEQKQRWLPGMVKGEKIGAIAMTEPTTGSDLKAIRTSAKRTDTGYSLNGSKTYITNGACADVIVVAAQTDPDGGSSGISLLLVDAEAKGLERGSPLHKVGQHAGDTTELFFNDVQLPSDDLLGSEGAGFTSLMTQLAQERLAIAIAAQATAQRAFDEAVTFTRERQAFGKPVFDFQNTRFTLADLSAQLQVGWAHIDWAISRHLAGGLAANEASAAKLFHTELQWCCCDVALQLHGGAGYMEEYAIARLWRDSRVTRIFGGTNEIMKEVIGRSL